MSKDTEIRHDAYEKGYERGFSMGLAKAYASSAQVAYRICAETRNVTLGDKVAEAIYTQSTSQQDE